MQSATNPIKIGYKKVKIVQNQIPTSIKPMVAGIYFEYSINFLLVNLSPILISLQTVHFFFQNILFQQIS